jgi:hypothetical protein
LEKVAVRKKWNGEGEIETRGKLTVTAFSTQLTSRGWRRQDLIPLVN